MLLALVAVGVSYTNGSADRQESEVIQCLQNASLYGAHNDPTVEQVVYATCT